MTQDLFTINHDIRKMKIAQNDEDELVEQEADGKNNV